MRNVGYQIRVLKGSNFIELIRGKQWKESVCRLHMTACDELIGDAFNFAFKGFLKSLFGRSKEKDGYVKWFAGNVASGSAAGATTSLFLYHLDYASTRMGTDAREVPCYWGMYFGIYDAMKPVILVGPLESRVETSKSSLLSFSG
ncbi:hypothetical protein HS088_TW20G00586 [Tripterygium wilfordii]|uniref:ADP/ATP translocase n=1 Tax=Tripterygium wilfordii TaxID=458696 RepID=A0A7J7C7U1_TRIWF|nr:hypothetical protein HS088_TW20G00586 [Tripterygium wilfordii]